MNLPEYYNLLVDGSQLNIDYTWIFSIYMPLTAHAVRVLDLSNNKILMLIHGISALVNMEYSNPSNSGKQ